MCKHFYIQYKCDHLAWDYDEKCPMCRADPHRFAMQCFPDNFTKYVKGACSVCQEEDFRFGNFGLIPNHSRGSRGGSNGALLTGNVNYPAPGGTARPIYTDDMGVVIDARKDSQGRPVDTLGRPLQFLAPHYDDGIFSFRETPSYSSGPTRPVHFPPGWVRQARNGYIPIEQAPQAPSVSSSSPLANSSSSPVSIINDAHRQGNDGGWSSSVIADNSDDSYGTPPGVLSRSANYVVERISGFSNIGSSPPRPVNEPSPKVVMEDALPQPEVRPPSEARPRPQTPTVAAQPVQGTTNENEAREVREECDRQATQSRGISALWAFARSAQLQSLERAKRLKDQRG